MKRTRELIHRNHPDWEKRDTISSLRDFDGEDLQYDSRINYQKNQQKDWIMQKQQENQNQKEFEKQEEFSYAQQTLELNRMRGMLEDEFLQKKKQMQLEVTLQNQQLAKEKRDKELQAKRDRLQYEKEEVDMTKQKGIKQQYSG